MNIMMKVLYLDIYAKEVFLWYRKVIMQDLDQIIALENIGFNGRSCNTRGIELRIVQIQETFIVAEKNDEVIGYITSPSHKRALH